MNNFVGNNPVVVKCGDQNQIVLMCKIDVGGVNTLSSRVE
jgi:hypothetical protein